MARRHRLFPGLLALGMAGCATVAQKPPNEGSASYHLIDDDRMAHYTLALGEIATGGKTTRQVPPVYPPTQLAACPPIVDVRVLAIVDTSGKVSEVRRYPAASGPAAPIPPAFFDAVRSAVMQWQFAPLQITHWAADADNNTHEVDSATKPFSMAYAFRFECRAGKATVTSTKG